MQLLSILIVLIVIGVLLWLVNTYIPMDAKIKQILNIIAIIATVLWVLKAFGAFNYLNNITI